VDIIRDTKPKKRKRAVIIASVVVGLIAVTLGVRQLPSAAPSVDRAVAWMDTVQRGTMVRMVRGPGTLVPQEARWITALTNGRVETIQLLPGAVVETGDVILEMTNPDVNMELLQAQTQLSEAQSNLVQLGATLETAHLQQRGVVAQIETQLADARRNHETNRRLFETDPDLVARADLERSEELMNELETRFEIEQQRLEIMRGTAQEQLDAQQVQIDRLVEQVDFNQNRLASLEVRAPRGGILSPLDIPLQEGQYVTAGTQLARIVVPGRLKAEVRIPQTQAQEIIVGQVALIDTRSDTIEGRVSRIDPSVRQGSVTIDVTLPEELPSSARPDLSVDGNVIIERLDDVLHVNRPSFGQADQQISLFRVTPDGEYAERVRVRIGQTSVNEIEVSEGLQEGDVVILSDMSQWDGFDRVRLR
jgi:multidrug resistance efflux pump